ncbi:MAG: glycosyltransferase family 2 protein [Thermaceae bacterium]|nr:glycosyltransferase family 2 protein [Thermaceae bacterium]
MKHKLSASVVFYNNTIDTICKIVRIISSSELISHIYLIDNSELPILGDLRDIYDTSKFNFNIKYIHLSSNFGFGKSHNLAIKEAFSLSVKYHLVLNPDVSFSPDVLYSIYNFMESNPDVANVMPLIKYPDGTIQYVAKLLPTPFHLFFRRFFPFFDFFHKDNHLFELRFSGYNKIMNVPNLSGCFMFLRVSALKEVGLFDERYFLYMEDTDLSRRLHAKYKTIFYPFVEIYHEHQKGSYKNIRLLFYHIRSAIYYFNKWGWFFDKERKQINRRVLDELGYFDSSLSSLPIKS